jgi:hypothetical protein
MLKLITYLLFCTFYMHRSTYFCRNKDMEFTLLSNIHPRNRHIVIQVLISRKWEFRGSSGSNPLQHIDMVLVDDQVSINIHTASAIILWIICVNFFLYSIVVLDSGNLFLICRNHFPCFYCIEKVDGYIDAPGLQFYIWLIDLLNNFITEITYTYNIWYYRHG